MRQAAKFHPRLTISDLYEKLSLLPMVKSDGGMRDVPGVRIFQHAG